MNQDFFEALALLEAEKGIPVESILDNIKNAINVAVRKCRIVYDINHPFFYPAGNADFLQMIGDGIGFQLIG